MNLELAIHAGQLIVTIFNSSAHVRRLWEWNNSWGWESLTIQIRTEAGQPREIKRKSRDFTKNGPVYFEMLPQEKREVVINFHDGWWEPALVNSQNQGLELRARLQIARTPESDQFGVFTGTVVSEWIKSDPQHRWLPTQG